MQLTMQVAISCSPEHLWKQLISREAFLKVSSPVMSYHWRLDRQPPLYWKTGTKVHLALRLFSIFPLGPHSIDFVQVEPTEKVIQTVENGLLIPCWKHRMKVINGNGSNESILLETLTINSGWRTLPLYVTARLFFKYRHFRLRKLLSL